MKKTMRNIILSAFIVVLALCAVFSCGIVFSNATSSASGGIFVGQGGNIALDGGIVSDNDRAVILNSGEHVIENVTISGSNNGAVSIHSGAVVTIRNCVIENNSNTANGGAIIVGEGATLIIENTRIKNNKTDANGGAIYACKNSVVTIGTGTIITANEGVFGGGIYLEDGARMNGGTGGLEYFTDNISTHDLGIWQNVYYEKLNLKLTLEGLNYNTVTTTDYGTMEATEMFDFNTLGVENEDGYNLNDYYTWLESASSSRAS